MGENTNKNLVGQPILTQVLALVDKSKFNGLVKKHESDRYYKKYSTWAHFTSMMFGIFSRCDSVTEIVEGMIGCVGKLGHFGLKEVPPKSTITDGIGNVTISSLSHYILVWSNGTLVFYRPAEPLD